MNLIQLLVKSLGGWPVDKKFHAFIAQDDDGDLWAFPSKPQLNGKRGDWEIHSGDGCYLFNLPTADDNRQSIITREQYESALAARKPEWDGEGLPPVGVNAEVLFCADTEPKWFSFLAKFIGENHVIALVGLEEISYKKDELLTSDVKFAPLRSEGDRKRDEITQSILDILNDYDFELVHIRSDQKRIAIDLVERITSGMIPHIRID